MSTPETDSPCTSCGACCMTYRVDFSAYELQSAGGAVPDGLAVEVNGHVCRMRGTDHQPVRCVALGGKLGEKVSCGIYEWRPNPCRELEPASFGCDRARIKHGLAPLGPGYIF